MMKLTDNQLEMTTKRTIMENEQMSIELSYQSRQTEKLLNKNAGLVEENAELRRQIELSKQTESELAKRNGLYQKTIKTLVSGKGYVSRPSCMYCCLQGSTASKAVELCKQHEAVQWHIPACQALADTCAGPVQAWSRSL